MIPSEPNEKIERNPIIIANIIKAIEQKEFLYLVQFANDWEVFGPDKFCFCPQDMPKVMGLYKAWKDGYDKRVATNQG